MKKIFALLFVIFIGFATFVSAQDTTKTYKQITFYFDEVTVMKDTTPVVRCGNFELTFSSTPGVVFFRNRDIESLSKITIGQHILDKALTIWYNDEQVPATVMIFDASFDELNVVFSVLMLNDEKGTIRSFGVTLDNYTMLFTVPETKK